MKKLDKSVYDPNSPATKAAEKKAAIAAAADKIAAKKRLQIESDLRKLV